MMAEVSIMTGGKAKQGKAEGGHQTHPEDVRAVQATGTETGVVMLEQTGRDTTSGMSTARVEMHPGTEHGAGTSIDIRNAMRIRRRCQVVTGGTHLRLIGYQAGVPCAGWSHFIEHEELSMI